MKCIIFTLLFALALPALASSREMARFASLTNDSITPSAPQGYKLVELKTIQSRGGLRAFLAKKTAQRMRDWSDFVINGGEYDNHSLRERRQMASNPNRVLEVRYILEIEEIYAVYKGRTLIGYTVAITDHVRAARIQDGAWYDLFLDADMRLVKAVEHNS